MMNWVKYYFLSTKHFYNVSKRISPWLLCLFIILFIYGLIGGLYLAPPDYQQKDVFRIMYVHVPAAFNAMLIYGFMASFALLTLLFRTKITAIFMSVSSKIGIWFTFLALITGSIWGKPTWGTWWIWDARLTSVLILFFLYAGFIALQSVISNREQRDYAGAILALIGVINLPIIHYSVTWWNTLHQGPSIARFAKPAIAPSMLYPLLAMILAFLLFYFYLLIIRSRSEILLRDIKSKWVYEVLSQ